MASLRVFTLALTASAAGVWASTPKEELIALAEAQAKQIEEQTLQIEALIGKQSALKERFAGVKESTESKLTETQAALTKGIKHPGRRLSKEKQESRRLSAPVTAGDIALSLDTMWVIICGALVMFMQAGFAVLEAGSVRAKNCGTVLLKNLIDVCLGTIMWYILGYGIAYGVDPDETEPSKAAGNQNFAGAAMVPIDDDAGLLNEGFFLMPKDWFFQWAFCATAATIVSGAVAERIQLPAYIVFSVVMTGFIYPMVVYWTWSTVGWLTLFWQVVEGDDSTKSGYSDFAGSGIVHMCGGFAALAAAVLVGPRAGRFAADKSEEFAPHNVPLCVLGTFILWFGWYGFNCGSTLYLKSEADALSAGLVAVNTTMAAAAGGLTVFILRLAKAMIKKQEQWYDCSGMCNGILAGLVAVCAGAGSFEPGIAMFVGILGGCFYEMGHYLMLLIRVDDPLDAVSVHGFAGFIGLLMKPLLRFEGADGDMFVAHLVGALVIIAWSAGLTALVLLPFKLAKLLTYSEDAQEAGTDVHCSPPKAYSVGPSSPEPVKEVGGI